MNEEKTGYQKFQEKVIELCKQDIEKTELIMRYADLEQDFDFVKGLNTDLSKKFDELYSCYPTFEEISKLIAIIEGYPAFYSLYDGGYKAQEYAKDRIIKLKKFKSALEALEKQNPKAKPIKYDDLVKE